MFQFFLLVLTLTPPRIPIPRTKRKEEGEDAAEPPPPPPPPPPPTRAKQAGGKIEQLWVCAVCTIKNDVKVKKCTMCGAYKAVVLEKFIDEAGSGARKER